MCVCVVCRWGLCCCVCGCVCVMLLLCVAVCALCVCLCVCVCVRASQRCVLRQNNRQTAAQQQKCHHFLAPSSYRASPRILAPKAPANRIPGTCTVHGGARHLRPGWLRRPAWPPAGHANDARLSPDCGRYLVPAAAAHTAGCVCRRAGRRYAARAVRRTFWRTCHLLPRAIHAIWAVRPTPTACDNLLPVYLGTQMGC